MSSLIRDRAAATDEMLAIFGDAFIVKSACRFEAALARAQSAEGLLSIGDAAAIVEACGAPDIDVAKLAGEAAHAGTLAIPLVERLRRRIAVKSRSAAAELHRGATSQDVADTILMLQAKEGAVLVEAALLLIGAAVARLTQDYDASPMTGRTLLQPALPITFGLKAANWLLGIDDALLRFRRERDGALQLQYGGGAGTLAGLQGKGLEIAARVAAELGLSLPPMPWHARRDSVAGLGAALAIVAGAAGKIARDIALLSQREVAEAFEPRIPGRGGSSTMAHKHNSTGCQIALSAAMRCPALAATLIFAMPHEHERGLGGWQAEAPVLADLFLLVQGALAAMLPVLENLEIDTTAMTRNLVAAGLAGDPGQAYALVERALERHRGLIAAEREQTDVRRQD
jgi:3-carboxy-cis,cis-muconate cycloisomerase